MRLFDRHSAENEEKAKSAMTSVAARLIGKYIVCQELLNSSLSGGGPMTKGKDESCLCCVVDKLTAKMAKFEVQLGQIIKTHEELFGTDLDIQSITNKAFVELYPTRTGTPKSGKSKNKIASVDMAEDTPEEVKDMIGAITKAVSKVRGGKDFDVRVLDMKNIGLSPGDFPNFNEYYKAVKAKLKTMEGKKGEEIINEAIIHTAEDKADAKPEVKIPTSNRAGKSSSKDTDKPN